jgi:RNA polymerase sigma-70 factor, ECF subfamily
MACHESVMEQNDQRRRVSIERSGLQRKAIDPDAGLVEQLRRREAGAAEALVAAYGDRAYRLAMRVTGNASDAEEVVQDALWAVSRKIDTFREAASFGSWLYRITANGAYQKLRERRSKRNEVSWDDLAPAFDGKGLHVEPTVDWSAQLTDPAIQAELRVVLRSAIDELPAENRASLLLHDVEGLSSPEIGELLEMKPATVKSRVHRARLFLRKHLADYMDSTPTPLD